MTNEEDLLYDVNAKYKEYVQASRKYIEYKSIDDVDVAKLQAEIGKLRQIVENRNETVSDLLHDDNRLNMSINEYKEMINSRDKTIECLKAELSSRGEDSKVLMDVVGIVKAWDERSGQAFPTMYELCDRLVDYIDVSELPITEDDSSGAEDYHVVVKVGFLEG